MTIGSGMGGIYPSGNCFRPGEMLWLLLLLLFVDGVLPLELLDWLSRIRSGSCSESGSSGSGSGSGMNWEIEGASLMGRFD